MLTGENQIQFKIKVPTYYETSAPSTLLGNNNNTGRHTTNQPPNQPTDKQRDMMVHGKVTLKNYLRSDRH